MYVITPLVFSILNCFFSSTLMHCYYLIFVHAVIVVSLVVQNGLLALSSVAMALMFYFEWTVCVNVVVFSVLTVIVILLTAGANLATVANTIAIEKDWVVVIADRNEDTLAGNYPECVIIGALLVVSYLCTLIHM